MLILWKGMKVTFAFILLVVLSLTSGLLTVLLFDKASGHLSRGTVEAEASIPTAAVSAVKPAPAHLTKPEPETIPKSVVLNAPVIEQNPELPSGCEVTSLAMLLQFAGISKGKVELAAEMPKDTTPIQLDRNGNIIYWGNPNVGFVGDVTGRTRGFGIYHTGLFPLLQKYLKSAVDLTGKPFEVLEKQVANGHPVIVWNTIDYSVPAQWDTWNSPLGPVQTTFNEHAVLMVGYDEAAVFVNDPLSAKKNVRIDKRQFVEAWKAMGEQALSYSL